jgi:four helix bundle protein
MFLQLAHIQKNVFQESKKFTIECYRITKDFPAEEKFALVQQIHRPALSTHLILRKDVQEGQNQKGSFF